MNELVTQQPEAAGLMAIIARAANDPNMDVAKLQALLAVKKEWEADEARKAFVTAFAAFKSEAVRIVKNKGITDGPLRGKRYADLFAVVDAVTPALSQHGLSASWAITKDEKDWIEVECILVHTQGHIERRSMGGPPDVGGAKNAIQARASAVSYLQRYTFLASVGMTSADSDTDGKAPQEEEEGEPPPKELLDQAIEFSGKGLKAYGKFWKELTVDQRKLIGPGRHADFKAKAEEVAA